MSPLASWLLIICLGCLCFCAAGWIVRAQQRWDDEE